MSCARSPSAPSGGSGGSAAARRGPATTTPTAPSSPRAARASASCRLAAARLKLAVEGRPEHDDRERVPRRRLVRGHLGRDRADDRTREQLLELLRRCACLRLTRIEIHLRLVVALARRVLGSSVRGRNGAVTESPKAVGGVRREAVDRRPVQDKHGDLTRLERRPFSFAFRPNAPHAPSSRHRRRG